jgi:hypothetical protein
MACMMCMMCCLLFKFIVYTGQATCLDPRLVTVSSGVVFFFDLYYKVLIDAWYVSICAYDNVTQEGNGYDTAIPRAGFCRLFRVNGAAVYCFCQVSMAENTI